MVEPLPEQLPFKPQYIFTDVDDTLTHNGRLPWETFNALHKLQKAGVMVVPVTGACGGWCDCMIRTWPIEAVIGENGAFIMSIKDNALQCKFMQDEQIRNSNKKTFDSLISQIGKELPEARLTGDCRYRLTDIAYDIGQDCRLNEGNIMKILALCHERGLHAKASSIHINIWQGEYSKYATADFFVQEQQIDKNMTIFIGDSTNDESMFTGWPTTVGVANIEPFLPKLAVKPTYITKKPGGFGFAEMAAVILGLNSRWL
jgi:HAD superfamily hydrolase (TIGR01484 family)